MIKILGDDNHINLTIWHLNQFTHACTQTQRNMYVYIYICKNTCQKFPSSLVKYLKCQCISQQARVELWGLGSCQTRPHHQLLATVLWVSQHWELVSPERHTRKTRLLATVLCGPREFWGLSDQDHCLQVCEMICFSYQSICLLAVIQAKNFSHKSNNSNVVQFRLSFRRK